MKVKFTKDAYIRRDPGDLSVPPVGVVYAGTELFVEDEPIPAASFDGNALWFRDQRGWFYWSGAASPVQAGDETPIISTEETNEQSTLQFDDSRMNWGIGALNIIDQFWSRDLQGEDIGIALLDTGLDYSHYDLQDSVAGYENFCEDAWGGNEDMDGSGTLSAGIIAGGGKAKVFGLAPEANLYVGKIMHTAFDFSFDALINGLQWASQMPVEIIYTSLALPRSAFTDEQFSQLSTVVDAITKLGKIIVAPAGNAVHTVAENRYPASLTGCLSVGAVDINGDKIDISLASERLDIVAPGEKLLTTFLANQTDYFGGTSAAAAFTTGVIALLIQQQQRSDREWDPISLIDLIKQTATPRNPNTKCRDLDYGCGFLNTIGLLERLGYSDLES